MYTMLLNKVVALFRLKMPEKLQYSVLHTTKMDRMELSVISATRSFKFQETSFSITRLFVPKQINDRLSMIGDCAH